MIKEEDKDKNRILGECRIDTILDGTEKKQQLSSSSRKLN